MKKIFDIEGDFQSLYAAQAWLTKQGFSYGSLCAPDPVGILKGDWDIAKWKNLTAKERKQLHGQINRVGNSFRGPVEVNITIIHEEI